MRVRLGAVGFSLILTLAGGCGDDTRPPGDAGAPDASATTDAGGRDAGRDGGSDAGGGGADDSFATAIMTTVNAVTEPMGEIDPAGDHDYYTFEAAAGDWLLVATTANAMDDNALVDTVITLYDATMTQVAENDDRVPRGDTDSEIIYHVPTTGTYYVMVQEFSDWHGDTPEAHPGEPYTLTIATLDPTRPAIIEDPETGNDAASATPIELGTSGGGIIVGTFASATDVDVFSLSVTTAETRLFQSQVMPAGTMGYGSTTTVAHAWVTNMAGDIIARVPDSAMLDSLEPPLPMGDHLLWIDHPAGAAGANDFYVLKVFVGMENPAEAGEATNGTLAGAETLTYETPMGMTGIRRAFVLASFPTAADVDYFAIDVMAGEEVGAACGAMTSGSGLTGLRVELRDASDAIVGTGVNETVADLGAILPLTAVPSPGTYYLRLSATGQDATVTGNWARCGFRAAVPTP